MTKKQQIKNYIINLIIGKQIKVGEKIPSEQALSQILKCSRNPVRTALQELTFANWVQPNQGSGYYVTGNGAYYSLFAKGAFGTNETEVRDLLPEEMQFKHILKNSSLLTKSFVKNYYRDNEIIMRTINFVNNDYLFYLNNKEISNGFVQGLLQHNIKITHQNREIIFYETLDKKTFQDFNWKNNLPIIKTSLYDSNKIIEISFIIIKKEYFSFEKKVIF